MSSDPEIVDGDVTWRFDRAFLTSNWTCIWGRGCKGILDEPAEHLNQGCCSIGAETDRRRRSHDHLRVGGDARRRFLPTPLGHRRRRRVQRRHPHQHQSGRRRVHLLQQTWLRRGRGVRAAPRRSARRTNHRPCGSHRCAGNCPSKSTGRCNPTAPRSPRSAGGSEATGATTVYSMHWCCTEGPEAYVGDRPVVESLADELIAVVGEPVYVELRRRLA